MTQEKKQNRELQIEEYNKTPVKLEQAKITEKWQEHQHQLLQEPEMQIQNHSSCRQLTTSVFDTTLTPGEIIAHLKDMSKGSLKFEVVQSVKSDSAQLKTKHLTAKLKFYATPQIGIRQVQFVKREGPQKVFDHLMGQIQVSLVRYLRPVYLWKIN